MPVALTPVLRPTLQAHSGCFSGAECPVEMPVSATPKPRWDSRIGGSILPACACSSWNINPICANPLRAGVGRLVDRCGDACACPSKRWFRARRRRHSALPVTLAPCSTAGALRLAGMPGTGQEPGNAHARPLGSFPAWRSGCRLLPLRAAPVPSGLIAARMLSSGMRADGPECWHGSPSFVPGFGRRNPSRQAPGIVHMG